MHRICRFSVYAFIVVTFMGTLSAMQGYSQNIAPVERGPVHEAYLPPVTGNLVLDALADRPPEPILEQIPEQMDSQTMWIPGYWAWSTDQNDFIWISGVWRRPPPSQFWISGYWENLEEGWVY